MDMARQEADVSKRDKSNQIDELRRRLSGIDEKNNPQEFINLSMAIKILEDELDCLFNFYRKMGWLWF